MTRNGSSRHRRRSSLYREIGRSDWARLAPGMTQPLTEAEIAQIRGLGDRLDMDEVREVYLPLSRLLSLYASAAKRSARRPAAFLARARHDDAVRLGIAGSVAVGKSTVARLLQELLGRWPDTPRVELVTTDGFLYPNAELERRGLMRRKGFPESYDRRALLRLPDAGQERRGRGARAGLLAPALRHRARRSTSSSAGPTS